MLKNFILENYEVPKKGMLELVEKIKPIRNVTGKINYFQSCGTKMT